MIVAASLAFGERLGHRMPLEQGQRSADIVQEQFAEVTAHAVAYEDALDDQVLPIGRDGIGGNLPSAAAQAV